MIKPRLEYVLIEPCQAEEMSKGGIIIAESAREKPNYGYVRWVGSLVPQDLKQGQLVMYGNYSANPIKTDDGKEVVIIKHEDIYAIVLNKGESTK